MINTTINAIIDIILSFLFGVAAQTRDDYARFGTAAALFVHPRPENMHLAKRNQPTPPFVPKHHAHALEAFTERKPPDGSKFRVIP